MAGNRIIIGNVTFSDERIESGNCFIGNSIAGDELAIDTLKATLLSPESNLTGLPYGTPVSYYHGDALVGKFYLQSVSRSGKNNYDIDCTSGVGLLDAVPHYGGLYTGESMTAVLADIIGGIVPYTVSAGVGAVRVYGWLPVATRRDNLRQVLFATGASLKKDTAGEINIVLLNLDAPAEISEDRLLLGGSVEYQAAISQAVVLEHGYIITASDEEATLYDDSVTGQDLVSPKGVALNGVLVTFDGPMHDLTSTGGAILESGINYAVLGPGGQTTLKGKRYTHTTREVRAMVEGVGGGAGGAGGGNGEQGQTKSMVITTAECNKGGSWSVGPGDGGNGGGGGAGGTGGRILQKTINVTEGSPILYTAGNGGQGGAAGAGGGAPGDDSVFGELTSASGNQSQYGYTDIFSGQAYGYAGKPGTPGGKGGTGGNAGHNVADAGANGEKVDAFFGGAGKAGSHSTGQVTVGYTGGSYLQGDPIYGTIYRREGGYGGGGAAVGSTLNGETVQNTGVAARAPDTVAQYGCGGNGGNGGGGGGGSGGYYRQYPALLPSRPAGYTGIWYTPDPQPGGAGSAGTPGASGCIIVYY